MRLIRIPSRGEQDHQVSKKIYIGNLPFSSTEEDLKDVFGRHGAVDSVSIITDRETGRPRGFAFVEMEEASAADDAIRALDGSDLGGRNIKVNEAQDRRSGGGGSRY
jgi:RNA recognition motif-containing protein